MVIKCSLIGINSMVYEGMKAFATVVYNYPTVANDVIINDQYVSLYTSIT